MAHFSSIIDDNIERIKKYYNDMRDRSIERYKGIFMKNQADAEILENLITSRGYEIVYHEIEQPIIQNTYVENKISSIHIRKKDSEHAVVLNYNISASKKEDKQNKLYLTIRHKTGFVSKKHSAKYYYARATQETPFIQIFANTEPETVDTFFLLVDGLSNVVTEEDYTKYKEYVCAMAKKNLQMIKTLKKLD